MKVTITVEDGTVSITAPYHPALPARARALGGKWNAEKRAWIFDARDETRVRQLAREIYGYSGDDTITRTVTVRHRLAAGREIGSELWMFGRLIIKRPSRDGAVRYGDGVVVVEGRFPDSGGSARYPAIGQLERDVVLEIRDVPASLVKENKNTWIVDDVDARRAQLEARITELRAELAALERQLAEM